MAWLRKSDRDGIFADNHGIAAVEFAVILPVLLLILFAVIQFGLLFAVQSAMESATEAGVRSAALASQRGENAGTAGTEKMEHSLEPWPSIFPGAFNLPAPACATDAWTVRITIPARRVAFFDPFGIVGPDWSLTSSAGWPARGCPEPEAAE